MHYYDLDTLLEMAGNDNLRLVYAKDSPIRNQFSHAPGSSHNHQAWPGGYLDHIRECLNIAYQQYQWMNALRPLPFSLADALVVMALHDIEKPWKLGGGIIDLSTKKARREFRDMWIIKGFDIQLTEAQKNALRYVEGVPDAEYTPGERTMGELAAFCHCVDIISARLWHDKGRDSKW